MSPSAVEKIANAVLYEGYMLYPYRPSATKNQRRFNFGVLVPPSYSARECGSESSEMQTECLVVRDADTVVNVRVRFLQVTPSPGWQEAVEREVRVEGCGAASIRRQAFSFSPVEGTVEIAATGLGENLHRLQVRVDNQTKLALEPQVRDEVLPYSLVSAHCILTVTGGAFVSLLDPPDDLRDAAAACSNRGVWPVLAGEPGSRDTMLASPIILYDYPQVAEESPGDLFDGGEIDEILSLRILTLTDAEKQEMRQSGDRARQILERTESMPEEQFLKLHGAVRGLRPSGGQA